MTIDLNDIKMDESWKQVLKDEFEKTYFSQIKQFLLEEKKQWNIVFPKWENIFNAFNKTTFDKVKVVILWQDPYHGEGEAHGLCFSVQDGIKQPPSLKNIFKEIESDLWFIPPVNGNLTKRAEQWVFLLNAILTVRKDTPASHKDIWWQIFTDAVIKNLSEKKDWLVFILWWAFAQSKECLIDTNRHYILKSPHPSPFSVHKWFFGCRHFSKTNEYLKKKWYNEIDRNLN